MWSSRRALAAIALASLCVAGAAQAAAPVDAVDVAAPAVSPDAAEVARWVLATRDNQGLPFAIVDKRQAALFLYAPRGRLVAASTVLLGMARGDESAPGVGALAPARIPVAERTTPAGRFLTEPGVNLSGEEVVWFDYDAGLAIHRLRPDAAYRARAQRMASGAPDDNRVSAGCVVVPVAFFENVVQPLLGRHRGVVYVLPETRSARQVFMRADDL
ncbi:MAG TPA: L,D-transpeptidase [Albitalea sp.]|nr:L,D-transpeptidase [Albitalea sp.]